MTLSALLNGRKKVSSWIVGIAQSFRSRGDCLPDLIQLIRHYWLLNFINATDYVLFEGKDLKQRANGMIQEFLRRIFSAGNPKRQLARSFHLRMTNKNLKVSGKWMHNTSFSKGTLE